MTAKPLTPAERAEIRERIAHGDFADPLNMPDAVAQTLLRLLDSHDALEAEAGRLRAGVVEAVKRAVREHFAEIDCELRNCSTCTDDLAQRVAASLSPPPAQPASGEREGPCEECGGGGDIHGLRCTLWRPAPPVPAQPQCDGRPGLPCVHCGKDKAAHVRVHGEGDSAHRTGLWCSFASIGAHPGATQYEPTGGTK
jgi:hypothetical protein